MTLQPAPQHRLLPLLQFTRHFATLVQCGFTLAHIARVLGEEAPAPYNVYMRQMIADLQDGETLTGSIRKRPELFPPFYLSMIRAGEVGGILQDFLGYLAELLEEQLEYAPLAVSGQAERWSLLSPPQQLLTLVLWCRALSMLLGAGVPTQTALKTAADFLPIDQQEALYNKVRLVQDEGVARTLESLGFLPQTVIMLVQAGERDGSLELMLEQAARLYHYQLRYLLIADEEITDMPLLPEEPAAETEPAAGEYDTWEAERPVPPDLPPPTRREELRGGDEDGPIIRMANVLIQNVIKQGASDVYIESTGKHIRVNYRIDGVLSEVMTLPLFAYIPLLNRLKEMADIALLAEPPQYGRFLINHEGKAYDATAAVTNGEHGEMVHLQIAHAGE